MATELERLASVYEETEAAFIRAVIGRASHPQLGELADATASAAKAYEAETYRALHAGDKAFAPLEELAEAAEQIASLWTDLADAYAGRTARSTNPHLGSSRIPKPREHAFLNTPPTPGPVKSTQGDLSALPWR